MRITGLATGLDMDEIIKNSMKPYRIKIDQQTQQKDTVEIKQKLYRDIMSDASDFYDKHFDILKSDSLLKSTNYSSVKFTSSDENKDIVTAKASGEAIKDTYTVSVTQLSSKASTTLKDGATGNQTITFDSGAPSLVFAVSNDGTKTAKENAEVTIANFNKAIEDIKKNNPALTSEQLKSLDITAKYSEISKGIVFEANDFGQDGFTLNTQPKAEDKYLHATITNSKGDTYEIKDVDKITSNDKTVDGITFNFNETCTNVKLTGKTDIKDTKEKIVNFVNDYNKLIKKLNTLTLTKHDRGYKPLTKEQKKEMSEDEIKLWNERVEKGQLYRDSDLTRITNSMKDTMRIFMKDSNLNLQKIGIKPFKDYGGIKNGTFTIEEDKLTEALENDMEGVMNLFTKAAPPATDEELKNMNQQQRLERKNKTGILIQLKNTLKTEFKNSDSILSKKVGMEGSSTFGNNRLTRTKSNYEKKIKDMEKDFAKREQALYSKYATLEKMMNKLNAQQSNLMSQLGMA